MPGVDFERIRAVVTMEQVLNLLGFEPTSRSGSQWYGSCPLPDCGAGRRRRQFLGERGERSLLLPSLPESWQPAGALGGGYPAERASSRDRPLPSPGLRHPLDSALVRACCRVIPTEEAGSHHQTRGKREEATGTDFVPETNHRLS